MSNKISAQQLATNKLYNYAIVSFKTPYMNSQYTNTMNNLYSTVDPDLYIRTRDKWNVKEYSYYMEMLIIMDYMEMHCLVLQMNFSS